MTFKDGKLRRAGRHRRRRARAGRRRPAARRELRPAARPEDYVHRIGRTGRAGATGEAISFVAPEEDKYLSEIEKMLKKKIDVLNLDGFDPAAAAARTPLRERSERPRRATSRDGSAATREATAPARARTPREATEGTEAPVRASVPRTAPEGRSQREIERELAYARNPDQPLPARSADDQGSANSRHAAKRNPIPALLMKRPTREPENA